MLRTQQKYNLVPYQTENGSVLEVAQAGEDVWLTQKQIAQLFNTTRENITIHIKNIFESGELDRNLVCKKNLQNDNHAGFRPLKDTLSTNYYNLDVIISVGYRVNSKIAIRFRQWATQVIKNKILQGYGSYNCSRGANLTDKKERAKYINGLLREKNITQKQIAKELGISNVTVCYTINGVHSSYLVNKWLKDNLFENLEEKTKKHPLITKAEKVFQSALNGDYKAYQKLLTLFETIYGFKTDNLGLEVVNG